MKNMFRITVLIFVLSLFAETHVYAQDNTFCPSLSEVDKQNPISSVLLQVDIISGSQIYKKVDGKPCRHFEEELPKLEETVTKKFFSSGAERADNFASGTHLFFSDRSKSRLETTRELNRTFSYISDKPLTDFKIKRYSEIDKSKTLETIGQPVQEVFKTQLVYPQERGEVQITFSSTYGRSRGKSLFQTPVSIEYGITKNWQVEIEWDVQSRRKEIGELRSGGTGDLSFGTQYSFMNMAGSNFHSAVGLEITLPTANIKRDLTEGFIEYEPYFLLAKDFPKFGNLQVFSQAGIGFNQRLRRHLEAEDDEPAAHELNLGVGAFVPFRQVVLTGEFNLSTNRWNHNGEEREVYFTPGIVWRLPRNFEMGFSAPVGLTRDAEKFGFIFKLVYEFNLLAVD